MLRTAGHRILKNLSQQSTRCFASQVTSSKSRNGKNIVLIDGVRSPFTQSGTAYNDLLAYELEKHAVL